MFANTLIMIAWDYQPHKEYNQVYIAYIMSFITTPKRKHLILSITQVYITYIINPKFPYYDVMNSHNKFVPRIVTSRAMKHKMHTPNWKTLYVFPSEFTSQSKFLPKCPFFMFSMHSQHWRMVTDLWRNNYSNFLSAVQIRHYLLKQKSKTTFGSPVKLKCFT